MARPLARRRSRRRRRRASLLATLSAIQCASNHSAGLTKVPPTSTEKCRWSPPAIPVWPLAPTASPRATALARCTPMPLRCP